MSELCSELRLLRFTQLVFLLHSRQFLILVWVLYRSFINYRAYSHTCVNIWRGWRVSRIVWAYQHIVSYFNISTLNKDKQINKIKAITRPVLPCSWCLNRHNDAAIMNFFQNVIFMLFCNDNKHLIPQKVEKCFTFVNFDWLLWSHLKHI